LSSDAGFALRNYRIGKTNNVDAFVSMASAIPAARAASPIKIGTMG
jgi:hypothetical protein